MGENNYGILLENNEPFIRISQIDELIKEVGGDDTLLLKQFEEMDLRIGGYFNNKCDEGGNIFSGFLSSNTASGGSKEEFKGKVLLFKLNDKNQIIGFDDSEVENFVKKIMKFMEDSGDVDVDYDDFNDTSIEIHSGSILLKPENASIEVLDYNKDLGNTIRKYIGHSNIISNDSLNQLCGVAFAMVVDVEANKQTAKTNTYASVIATYSSKEYTEILGNVLVVKVEKDSEGIPLLTELNSSEIKTILNWIDTTKRNLESNEA